MPWVTQGTRRGSQGTIHALDEPVSTPISDMYLPLPHLRQEPALSLISDKGPVSTPHFNGPTSTPSSLTRMLRREFILCQMSTVHLSDP